MALFGSKKKIESKETPKKEVAIASAPAKKNAPILVGAKDVLLRPRITEKAANMTAVHVYTFDIRPDTTKKDVVAAVKALYKVVPLKVNVVNTPAKRVRLRRKRGFGTRAAMRKAYVFLKKGEEIQFT